MHRGLQKTGGLGMQGAESAERDSSESAALEPDSVRDNEDPPGQVDQMVSAFLTELNTLDDALGGSPKEGARTNEDAGLAQTGPEGPPLTDEDDLLSAGPPEAATIDLDIELADTLDELEREQARLAPPASRKSAYAEAETAPEPGTPAPAAPARQPLSAPTPARTIQAHKPPIAENESDRAQPNHYVTNRPIFQSTPNARVRNKGGLALRLAIAAALLLAAAYFVTRPVPGRKTSPANVGATTMPEPNPSPPVEPAAATATEQMREESTPEPTLVPTPEPDTAKPPNRGGLSQRSPGRSVPAQKSGAASKSRPRPDQSRPADSTRQSLSSTAQAQKPAPAKTRDSAPSSPVSQPVRNPEGSTPASPDPTPVVSKAVPAAPPSIPPGAGSPPAKDRQIEVSDAGRPAAVSTKAPAGLPKSAVETPPAPYAPPTPAVAIRKVVPTYPAAARRYLISGTVEVDAGVDEKGTVVSATSVSGPPELRSAAEEAARKWLFKPASLRGVNLRSTVRVSFTFRP